MGGRVSRTGLQRTTSLFIHLTLHRLLESYLDFSFLHSLPVLHLQAHGFLLKHAAGLHVAATGCHPTVCSVRQSQGQRGGEGAVPSIVVLLLTPFLTCVAGVEGHELGRQCGAGRVSATFLYHAHLHALLHDGLLPFEPSSKTRDEEAVPAASLPAKMRLFVEGVSSKPVMSPEAACVRTFDRFCGCLHCY